MRHIWSPEQTFTSFCTVLYYFNEAARLIVFILCPHCNLRRWCSLGAAGFGGAPPLAPPRTLTGVGLWNITDVLEFPSTLMEQRTLDARGVLDR